MMMFVPRIQWLFLIVFCCVVVNTSSDKPPYPVSASWFKDRFSKKEWDSTLDQFSKIGGDTIILTGAQFINRTKENIMNDARFFDCYEPGSSQHCVLDAIEDMKKANLMIAALTTYQYEEDYSNKIVACPKLDKKISVGSNTYHRIVLHTSIVYDRNECEFKPNEEVIVLFTSFSGVDPHALALESAGARNMKVFFGLPVVPPLDNNALSAKLSYAYFEWTNRILTDHADRFPSTSKNSPVGYYTDDNLALADITKPSQRRAPLYSSTLYSSRKIPSSFYIQLYRELNALVHYQNKKFMVAPFIDLRKSSNNNLTDHVMGMEALCLIGGADIVAVREGRGTGRAGYFWENQLKVPIKKVDENLFNILKRKDGISDDSTFGDVYFASIQELFSVLATTRDTKFSERELWLTIEAFEDLDQNDCPINVSEIEQKVSKTTKTRLDWSLTAAGADPQKVALYAWDNSMVCDNSKDPSLLDELITDIDRPIISYCNFHNPQNLSVVVKGYNLLRLTQGFEVDYIDYHHNPQTTRLNGYYYETDYGNQHHRPSSMVYIMLWDFLPLRDFIRDGFLTVRANDANHECSFKYSI